jgi:type I restriction enzyme S subunit
MVRFQVEIVQYGAAQEQFNVGHAINFWIATPPRNEQTQIARYLKSAIAQFESLSAKARQAISLLQERRAALISAAVTGQIDVRQAVARDSSTTEEAPA